MHHYHFSQYLFHIQVPSPLTLNFQTISKVNEHSMTNRMGKFKIEDQSHFCAKTIVSVQLLNQMKHRSTFAKDQRSKSTHPSEDRSDSHESALTHDRLIALHVEDLRSPHLDRLIEQLHVSLSLPHTLSLSLPVCLSSIRVVSRRRQTPPSSLCVYSETKGF